jgi:hypothetical protein
MFSTKEYVFRGDALLRPLYLPECFRSTGWLKLALELTARSELHTHQPYILYELSTRS